MKDGRWLARPTPRALVAGSSVALALASLACASVTVRRLTSDMDSAPGIRFYRPAPYVLVEPVAAEGGSAPGAVKVSIIWLPDYTQQYVIEAKPGLGSVSFNPTLTDGWNLTGFDATVDSKTAELLTAAPGLVPRGPTGVGQPPKICPGIYRLDHGPDGKLVPLRTPEEWQRAAVVSVC
jgi:hypothetical protein